MAAKDLFSFDLLARREIDQALAAIVTGVRSNPDYIVSVFPDSSPTRTRCSLDITNRRTGQVSEALIIKSVSNGEVEVLRSAAIIDNGTPHIVHSFKWAGVNRKDIENLAQVFVDNFFRLCP